MKKYKFTWAITFIAVMLFLTALPVYGGDPARIGTAAGEQLLVPVGARTMAMGGSNPAFTKGLEAIYWNPAGLSSMPTTAAGVFSTMQIFNDINVNYIALGVKAGRIGHFGFSLKSFDFGDIPLTTNEDMDGLSGQTFSPTFITAGLTYSRALTDAIQVGVKGKLVSERIPRAQASAFAVDIGIQYHNLGNIQGVSMGLVVKNIGTNLQYSGSGLLTQATDAGSGRQEFRSRPSADHQLPATVELGVGYKRNINEQNAVIVNGNFQNNNFGDDDYKLGLEYTYTDLVALRGGYVFNNKESEDQLYTFSLGLGLHYKLGNTDLTFNYAFRDVQYFDGNNLFEFIIGF
jgi:hypothetical protein